MDHIRLDDADSKVHWLIDKFAVGNGKTACGMVIENGITGATAYAELIDCGRCARAINADRAKAEREETASFDGGAFPWESPLRYYNSED